MLIEGFKLMVIGMATVLLFLSLMIILINLASRATTKVTARELELIEIQKRERAANANTNKVKTDGMPIAVFAAAIAAYETNKTHGS
jgi:sodium pump decarboxylase gamma subunit